jgi:cell division ATPase FtsA
MGSREALGRLGPEIVSSGGAAAMAGMLSGLGRIPSYRLRYRDPRRAVSVLEEITGASS